MILHADYTMCSAADSGMRSSIQKQHDKILQLCSQRHAQRAEEACHTRTIM